MKMKPNGRSGLSAPEVGLIVIVIILLAMLFLPTFARTGHRRPPCVSSLKTIGLAYRLWSNDHDAQFPFVSTDTHGSRTFIDSPEVFRHFQVMSNELNTPRTLVCPEDKNRRKADDFAHLSNLNVSYFVGLDANERNPERFLSGDRNISGGTLSNGFMRRIYRTDAAQWTQETHSGYGNILCSDGAVLQLTSQRLRAEIEAQNIPVIRLAIP